MQGEVQDKGGLGKRKKAIVAVVAIGVVLIVIAWTSLSVASSARSRETGQGWLVVHVHNQSNTTPSLAVISLDGQLKDSVIINGNTSFTNTYVALEGDRTIELNYSIYSVSHSHFITQLARTVHVNDTEYAELWLDVGWSYPW